MRIFEDMQKNVKNGAEQVVDVRDSKFFEGVVGDLVGENILGKDIVMYFIECFIRLVKIRSIGRK